MLYLFISLVAQTQNNSNLWFLSPEGIEGLVLWFGTSLICPIIIVAIFRWKEFRKYIPLKPSYELFAFANHDNREIAKQFPFRVKVKKSYVTQNLNQVTIAKLKTPLYWNEENKLVRYVVLSPYVLSQHIEKWCGSILMYVAFVTDESIVKDYFPDIKKYKFVAVCWGKEVGFYTEKNSAEGMHFSFKYYRELGKTNRNRGNNLVENSATILRQLPNLDDTNRYYWIAKCDTPIQLEETPTITYLVINNALIGDRLKHGFDEMTLNIWYVIDDTTIDDLNVDLDKCLYATECKVKFDKK